MSNEIKDFIGVYPNMFPKEMCDKAIKFFDDMNAIGVAKNRQETENRGRTDKDDKFIFLQEEDCQSVTARDVSAHFNNLFWNLCYDHYSNKFDVLTTSDSHKSYHLKVQKTDVGGGYHVWHYESMSRAAAGRLLVWILYLNDVEEGGETEFLYYPRRIKPEAGTLVLFPAAFTHTHRGNPPLSNTKYIMTGWVEF